MNADVIHQAILSYQVRVKFQLGFNFGEGKDHIILADTCSQPLLDNTKV